MSLRYNIGVAIRAIALDLDGTLVKTGVLEISPADREAIQAVGSSGVHVVLATARTPDPSTSVSD